MLRTAVVVVVAALIVLSPWIAGANVSDDEMLLDGPFRDPAQQKIDMTTNNGILRQMNEHVEFKVQAEEDLYLTGSEMTIRRVTAETNYSLLMPRTQIFLSVFQHYAKYHGLRMEDLEYYFVNVLEDVDTPQSVRLVRGDTITVRHKRTTDEPPEADDEEFVADLRDLLDDEEHTDCRFLVKTDEKVTELKAHKSILTVRAEHFKELFRNTQFAEGTSCEIVVEPNFTVQHVRAVLEFLYTNRIRTISAASTDDLFALLHLSDKWLLRDLKRLVEMELIQHHLSVESVARMYGATEDVHAERLRKACMEFIVAKLKQLASNPSFEGAMMKYPQLPIQVLKATAELIPEGGPVHKKQRTDHHASSPAVGQSPVPDSDT